MKYLRQRRGLEENDTEWDDKINDYNSNKAFKEVLEWQGLLGGWDRQIKGYVQDIYGINLDEVNTNKQTK